MDAEQVEVPQVERQVALDLAKRGALVAPAVVVVAGLVRGWDGALSAAVGIGIVIVNWLAAAVCQATHTGCRLRLCALRPPPYSRHSRY